MFPSWLNFLIRACIIPFSLYVKFDFIFYVFEIFTSQPGSDWLKCKSIKIANIGDCYSPTVCIYYQILHWKTRNKQKIAKSHAIRLFSTSSAKNWYKLYLKSNLFEPWKIMAELMCQENFSFLTPFISLRFTWYFITSDFSLW